MRSTPRPTSNPPRALPSPKRKRLGDVLAVRFGLEEDGEDYGVIVEAASCVGMRPSEFVREFALFQAHKILRGKRARSA